MAVGVYEQQPFTLSSLCTGIAGTGNPTLRFANHPSTRLLRDLGRVIG